MGSGLNKARTGLRLPFFSGREVIILQNGVTIHAKKGIFTPEKMRSLVALLQEQNGIPDRVWDVWKH